MLPRKVPRNYLGTYVLRDRVPVPASVDDAFAWSDDKRVAETDVGSAWVSTVFLGIDHNFGLEGPPVLFETMVFADEDHPEEGTCIRSDTWATAEAVHRAVCSRVADYHTRCVRDAILLAALGSTWAVWVASIVGGMQ